MSQETEPLVSIIIPNWNGEDLIEICLNSLVNNTDYKNLEIIVIDNGSVDNSCNLIKTKFKEVKLIELEKNYGFSIAVNLGIKNSKGSYVCFLNNDTEMIEKDWLKKLIDFLEKNKEIGACSCISLSYGDNPQATGGWLHISGLKLKRPEDKYKITEVDTTVGPLLLTRKEVIEKIGFLDEGFSPFNWEEVDFCIRAKKAGYKITYIPITKIRHLGGKSMEHQEDIYKFKVTNKNRIRFKLLNFPLSWLIISTLYEIKPFLSCIFIRSENKYKLRKDFIKWIFAYLEGYFINIKNLKEILKKRKNRTMKILPKETF
jgi:GT2 family glycosyltransferase